MNIQELKKFLIAYYSEYWSEKKMFLERFLSEMKAVTDQPCAASQLERGDKIMTIGRDTLGSPITELMQSFMDHPSAEQLVQAHPYSSSLTTAQAAQAAVMTALLAERVKTMINVNFMSHGTSSDNKPITQENCDWMEQITNEIAAFAQVVANFKARHEAAEATYRRKLKKRW